MIILTGGAGFIGSNILKRLNVLGEEDILVVDNLKNADKYRNLVGAKFTDYISKDRFLEALSAQKFGQVKVIFHQGACSNTMEYDGDYMMRNNFDYSKEMLHYAVAHCVPLIYASTAAVYGHSEIARENELLEAPLNIYGYSKLLFDQCVRRLSPRIESTVVGLRYFNVYGNGEAHKHKMASMIYQFYNQVRTTGAARVFGSIGPYGPGEQTRDFIHVDDLVELNLFFWQRDPVQTIVNAGTGVSRTWNDVANAVIKAAGRGRIEYIEFPEALKDKYQFNTRADLTHLRSLNYDREFLSLEAGVHQYLSTIETDLGRFKPQV